MNDLLEHRFGEQAMVRPKRIQPAVGILAILLAVIPLIGWIFDLDELLVGEPPIDPSTAMGFGITGVASLFVHRSRRRIGTLLGAATLALAIDQIIALTMDAPSVASEFWPEAAKLAFPLGAPGFSSALALFVVGLGAMLTGTTRPSLLNASSLLIIAVLSFSTVRLIEAMISASNLPVRARVLYGETSVFAAAGAVVVGAALLDSRPDSLLYRSMYQIPREAARVSRNILLLVCASLFLLVVVDIDTSASGTNSSHLLLLVAWLFWGGVAIASSSQVMRIEQQRSAAVDALSESEQRFRRLADDAPDAILRFGSNPTRVVYANARIEDLTGYPPEAFLADRDLWKKLIVAEDRERVPDWNADITDGRVIVRVRNRTGMVHWIEARLSPARDEIDGGIGADAIIRDITDSKRAEANLTRRAYLDPVTNLANRNAVEEQLGYLAEAYRHPARTDLDSCFAAVLFLDLDGFKSINDRLGHDAGDHILMLVGERLRASVKDEDLVARFGGDEFVIVLDGLRLREQADAVANRILLSLRSPFVIGDRQLHVTTSVGVTTLDRNDPKDPGTLLREADRALYLAKGTGKDRVRWFDVNDTAGTRPVPILDMGAGSDQVQTAKNPSGEVSAAALRDLPRSGRIDPHSDDIAAEDTNEVG